LAETQNISQHYCAKFAARDPFPERYERAAGEDPALRAKQAKSYIARRAGAPRRLTKVGGNTRLSV
jgi:hypothetical protein